MPVIIPTVRQFYCVCPGPPYKEFNVNGGPDQTATDGVDIPYGLSVTPGSTSDPEIATEGVITDTGLVFTAYGTGSTNRTVYCAQDGSLTQDITQGYRPIGVALGVNTLMLQFRTPVYRNTVGGKIRPVIISDNSPYLQQAPNSASVTSELRSHLGIGGTTNSGLFANRDVVFEFTNNTTLTVKMKGDDGTTRTATITVS